MELERGSTQENVVKVASEPLLKEDLNPNEPLEEEIKNSSEEQVINTLDESFENLSDKETGKLIEKETEDNSEETIEEEAKKPEKNHKKIAAIIIISLSTLLAIYFGMVMYFTNRFYFGSEINCINVSGKTVEDVKTLMATQLQAYTLNIKERGGKSEQIKATDIGLMYNSDDEFKNLKDNQNPFKWVLACFTSKESKMIAGVAYDDKLLKERIDGLSAFDINNIIEPKNPSFQYVDNKYVIVDEVQGNKIDKEILYPQIKDSVLKQKTELDLEETKCYINPQYTSKSQKTIENMDILNKYVSSKIIYTFGNKEETLDGSTINKWLMINENFEAIINEEMARDYVDGLAKAYNTVGRTRSFVTSSGKTINIGGGDYGWAINKTKETQNLISAIKEGRTMTKEPAYSQTAYSRGSNDIGNTYVEIDLSKQHLWFYKNGSLIVEGDIVTGNVKNNFATPKGIYRLKYKDKDAVLRGPDYAAPVTFWMPFNGGIGIHDASWRKTFGGKIYLTNGSHGCVNAPYNVAKEIFYNITAGTPVICY